MILLGLLFGRPPFLRQSLRFRWIEQLTNAIAQAAIFTGILFLFYVRECI